jgi:hypothetical protein
MNQLIAGGASALGLFCGSTALAGLMGLELALEAVDTGYGPAGQPSSLNMGTVVVGSGVEWSQTITTSQGAQLYMEWDFADTSVTFSMDVLSGNVDTTTFSPAWFNGIEITDVLGGLANFAGGDVASTSGGPVTFIDFYGLPPNDPALEQWLLLVDTPVEAASRVEAASSDLLMLNIQGIVWTDPDQASIVFDLDFIPSPGALALLGIAAIGSHRRRRH